MRTKQLSIAKTKKLLMVKNVKRAVPFGEKKKCSICKEEYIGWGNNAWPINEGRCCNDCNDKVVLARLKMVI